MKISHSKHFGYLVSSTAERDSQKAIKEEVDKAIRAQQEAHDKVSQILVDEHKK